MKNIRYKYRFHFFGNGINTKVEIKASTLKDLYYKLLHYEPVLECLSNYTTSCMLVKEHTRSYWNPLTIHRNWKKGFLPSQVMGEHNIKIAFYGK